MTMKQDEEFSISLSDMLSKLSVGETLSSQGTVSEHVLLGAPIPLILRTEKENVSVMAHFISADDAGTTGSGRFVIERKTRPIIRATEITTPDIDHEPRAKLCLQAIALMSAERYAEIGGIADPSENERAGKALIDLLSEATRLLKAETLSRESLVIALGTPFGRASVLHQNKQKLSWENGRLLAALPGILERFPPIGWKTNREHDAIVARPLFINVADAIRKHEFGCDSAHEKIEREALIDELIRPFMA
jgi:hypothetical protein